MRAYQLFMSTTLLLITQTEAFCFNLKGKLMGNDIDATEFTVVVEDSDGTIKSVKPQANGKFTITGVGRGDRISLLKDSNYYGPVVMAVQSGRKIKPYSIARNKDLCQEDGANAIMALRKSAGVSLPIQVDTDGEFGYLKKALASKFFDKDADATVDESCQPSGIETPSGSLSVRAKLSTQSDVDGDGKENADDIDDDNDGLSDTFDPDNDGDGIIDDSDSDNNDQVANRVWNFQQLHLNREDAFNTRVTTVSTETIDNALVEYGGLALQVIDGTSVELNCGGGSEGEDGLKYCSSGGPGRAREPYPDGLALPDEMDSDGDGKGEISAGDTGDFQVAPGATSSEILPGDTFIEEVTDSDNKVTEYAGMINGVVHDVPGIVSITTTLATHTFTYPGDINSIGSAANPIPVPSAGDVVITVTTYLPHYNTGGETRVVPAGVKMIANIPNGPCTYNMGDGQCTGGGSGPGLIPGSLYSNPSTGWQVTSDGVQSTAAEDTPEGEDTTVTYTVNLSGSGGVTGWDSGEQVKVPIQSIDNNGTTAAHNVWFKRQ